MQSASELLHIAEFPYVTSKLLWGSSHSIAIQYGMDIARIESRWRRDFPRLSRTTLQPNQPSALGVLSLSREVERTGRGVDQLPPSGAQFKKKIKAVTLLYLWLFIDTSKLN